jgi:hypothetical protein
MRLKQKPQILDKCRPVLTNRNTDTRFDLNKKRKAPTAKITHNIPNSKAEKQPKKARGRGGGGKQECDLGMSCPYREEYQHQLEFAHNNSVSGSSAGEGAVGVTQAFVGRGNTLGGATTSTTSASAPSSSFFESQAGQRIGGSSSGFGGSVSDSWGGAVHPLLRGKGPGKVVGRIEQQVEEGGEYVECTYCTALVELSRYDRHLQTHETETALSSSSSSSRGNPFDSSLGNLFDSAACTASSSSSHLMREQDREFEKAELEDLLRMTTNTAAATTDTATATPSLDYPHHQLESGLFQKRAVAVDIIDLEESEEEEEEEEARREAIGAKISLAFRFKFSSPGTPTSASPRPTKLVQTFRVDNLLHDVFLFLDGVEALTAVRAGGGKWELRASFGNKTFNRQRDAKETLESLSIAANTMFVVQEL